MAELDYKSKHNNPIFAAQSVSKLIERIKNKQNSEAALKYLKDKCITSEDVVTSLAASRGLIMLVECELLQVSTTLSELVSALPVTKSYVGIIAAICDLLQIDLKYRIRMNKGYKCPFNLRAPQHPFISVLNRQPNTWVDILSRIKSLYESDCEQVTFYANELLYPFYMYVICDPTSEVLDIFQHKLWNWIISINKQQSVDVLLYTLMWLQTSTQQHSIKTSNFLIDLASVAERTGKDDDFKEILILWLMSLLHELCKQHQDPRSIIACLHNIIRTYEHLNRSVSTLLIIIADTIPLCSSVYLSDLLRLGKLLVQLNLSNTFALYSLKASLLHWLAYGCVLTTDSLQIANEILLHIDNNDEHLFYDTKQLHSNKKLCFLKNTNQYIYLAVELSILSESLTATNILDWLNNVEKLPIFCLKNVFNYFTALLLYEFDDPRITVKVIDILLKITDIYKETTVQVLTLLLYKLSNSTTSRVHFALLKALPKMAVLKENLSLVLNTLELVRKGMSGIKSFAITLFFDLWDVDSKCYPYLQTALLVKCEKNEGATQWWEFYITKAYVLKQICLKRPELHGRELVGHLSDILNKCSGESGALASALGIDGIKVLCRAGIIDITSTWNELAPRFSNETRVAVIKSLCGLMAEVSYFELSECPDKLLEEIIAKLWHYGTMHEDPTVIAAAYNALSCFALEQLSGQLYNIIENKESSTPRDTIVLSFNVIKGDYWISLMLQSQCTALDAVGDLLVKHVSAEISRYHSSTYKVEEGRREPQDLNYLPEHSIVRALGNYIRKQVQKWQDSTIKQTYLQCLRVLSKEYSKPLPPTDWCFLQELVHAPETRFYCITLASHQVQLSGTARRLIENYIAALTHMDNNDNDIRTIYENLKYLCNSIQPMTLRPFIETSMAYALKKAQNSDKIKDVLLFETAVDHLKATLNINEGIHEANRLVLSQIIVHTAQQLNVEHSLFAKLLECIVALPKRYIDELSSPRLWKEATPTQLRFSVRIRCALALQANVSSLTWMNDFIDAACFMPSEHHYILRNIIQVMKSHRNSDFASAWTLELLGHIQSTIANENTTTFQLQLLCDVYILSMVVLSGQDIFIDSQNDLVATVEHRLRLFPQSVAQLMKLQRWKSYTSQITEWLFHMTNLENIPESYRISFYQSLAALKSEETFEKHSKWMKYLGSTSALSVNSL